MQAPPENEMVDLAQLRSENYNAEVESIRLVHDDLMILRVRPDIGVSRFLAGQYTVLGLGYWEPRAADCQPEGDITALKQQLIKRAYSVSSPILNDAGVAVGVNELGFLEFYIALIRQAREHPPALTPRIFALEPGSRIFCGPRFHGRYGLEPVSPESNVIFAGTGTGEAPHNAMIGELLRSRHQGRIVHVSCVRHDADLAYLATHRRVEAKYPNYRYIALTTREPRNVDASRSDYVGKQYVQEFFSTGGVTTETGLAVDPGNTHVFLCGNPEMIGVPQRSHDPSLRFPKPTGMVETLQKLGFEIDRPHQRGNIHFEKYW